MRNSSSPIRAQKDLIQYLRDEQPKLIKASKDTLHKQHYANLTICDYGVIITKAPTDLHKQLFTLMLKRTWEQEDLHLIVGYCALIHLITTASPIQLTNNNNLTAITNICQGLWKNAFIFNNAKDKPILMTCFNLEGIELVQDIDCPLDYVNALPNQSRLFARSTGGSSFQLSDITYHARILFKYHVSDTSYPFCTMTIKDQNYQVKIDDFETFTHNAYKRISNNRSYTPIEKYIESKADYSHIIK
jgi:hypothetical protein